VDKFLRLLEVEGVDTKQDSGRRGRKRPHYQIVEGSVEDKEVATRISADEVAIRVFSLWAGRVQRGLMDLHEGEVGAWDERFLGLRRDVLARRDEWRSGVERVKG
jgi:hypothetical protein